MTLLLLARPASRFVAGLEELHITIAVNVGSDSAMMMAKEISMSKLVEPKVTGFEEYLADTGLSAVKFINKMMGLSQDESQAELFVALQRSYLKDAINAVVDGAVIDVNGDDSSWGAVEISGLSESDHAVSLEVKDRVPIPLSSVRGWGLLQLPDDLKYKEVVGRVVVSTSMWGHKFEVVKHFSLEPAEIDLAVVSVSHQEAIQQGHRLTVVVGTVPGASVSLYYHFPGCETVESAPKVAGDDGRVTFEVAFYPEDKVPDEEFDFNGACKVTWWAEAVIGESKRSSSSYHLKVVLPPDTERLKLLDHADKLLAEGADDDQVTAVYGRLVELGFVADATRISDLYEWIRNDTKARELVDWLEDIPENTSLEVVLQKIMELINLAPEKGDEIDGAIGQLGLMLKNYRRQMTPEFLLDVGRRIIDGGPVPSERVKKALDQLRHDSQWDDGAKVPMIAGLIEVMIKYMDAAEDSD